MKAALRKQLITKRNQLSDAERSRRSHQIFEELLPYLMHARCVGIYKHFGSEVKTDEIIRFLLQHDKIVAVPRCEDKGIMQFYQIDETTLFQKNKMGIEEPVNGKLLAAEAMDLMLVPMVGFYQEQRLGYGGGFYDRYLIKCDAYKIGLAFAIQQACFDIEATDISMDLIIHDEMKRNPA